MTIECWTVIHRVTEPIRRAAPIHRIVGRLVHARPPLHALPPVHAAVPHVRTWTEVVCRVLPAAVMGGGALIPHPAGLPPSHPLPPPPPAIVAPPNVVSGPPVDFAQPIRFAPPIYFPPSIRNAPPVAPPVQPTLPPSEIAEPASLAILLGGLAGLAFLPVARHWIVHRGGGDDLAASASGSAPRHA